jgi:hypothetical protein
MEQKIFGNRAHSFGNITQGSEFDGLFHANWLVNNGGEEGIVHRIRREQRENRAR